MMSRLGLIFEGNEHMGRYLEGSVDVPCASDGGIVTFDADVVCWRLVGSVDDGIAIRRWTDDDALWAGFILSGCVKVCKEGLWHFFDSKGGIYVFTLVFGFE